MDPKLRQEADRRLEDSLASWGGPDPRQLCRQTLRQLRERDPEAYERAVAHYEAEVVPAVARGEADPLLLWRQYGRFLAELLAPGRTLAIDPSGRASPLDDATPLDCLVIHLPEGGGRAVGVFLPPALSPPQRATWELLVEGRLRASA